MVVDPPSSPAVGTTLIQILKDLRELTSVWAWCASALQGIGKLVERLKIELPEEAWNALSAPPSSTAAREQGVNAVHANYDLMSGNSLQYPKVKIEVPRGLAQVGENTCDPSWDQLGNDDFQFVESMINFPTHFDDWGCVASET